MLYTDLSLGYKGIRISDRVNLKLKLDVKNVFDDQDLIYTSEADNSYGIDFILPTPREIRLTSTFTF